MSIAILSMAVIQLLLMGVIILGVRLTHIDLVSLAMRSRESASFDAKCLMDSTMKRLDDIDTKLDHMEAIMEYVEVLEELSLSFLKEKTKEGLEELQREDRYKTLQINEFERRLDLFMKTLLEIQKEKHNE